MSPQTLRGKAELRLAPEDGPEFQIAPMIDILLVLLVFFMSISSTEVLRRRQDVSVPEAREGKIDRGNVGQTVINVAWSTLNHTGSIEIDNQHFAQAAGLRELLQLKAHHSPTMRVLIRADRNVPYDFLRPLMIAISEAGIGKVAFAVVNPPLALPPSPH